MKKILLVFAFLLAGVASAKAPEEQAARFDFRSLGVAQVVQLIYAEALESS